QAGHEKEVAVAEGKARSNGRPIATRGDVAIRRLHRIKQLPHRDGGADRGRVEERDHRSSSGAGAARSPATARREQAREGGAHPAGVEERDHRSSSGAGPARSPATAGRENAYHAPPANARS